MKVIKWLIMAVLSLTIVCIPVNANEINEQDSRTVSQDIYEKIEGECHGLEIDTIIKLYRSDLYYDIAKGKSIKEIMDSCDIGYLVLFSNGNYCEFAVKEDGTVSIVEYPSRWESGDEMPTIYGLNPEKLFGPNVEVYGIYWFEKSREILMSDINIYYQTSVGDYVYHHSRLENYVGYLMDINYYYVVACKRYEKTDPPAEGCGFVFGEGFAFYRTGYAALPEDDGTQPETLPLETTLPEPTKTHVDSKDTSTEHDLTSYFVGLSLGAVLVVILACIFKKGNKTR